MATSALPFFADKSPRTQVVAHTSLKMAQVAALAAPPLIIATSILRRNPLKPFTIKRLLNTTIAWTVAGAGAGGGVGYVKLMDEPETAILARVQKLRYNATQVRADDYSFIGAALAGVVVPAVLLRRAPFPTLVAGGACIGLGLGAAFHMVQSASEGEDIKPTGMVGDVPVIGGNK